MEAVGELLGRAKELELDVFGVSFHVGSACTDSLVFKQAIADARHAFDIAVSCPLQEWPLIYFVMMTVGMQLGLM